MLAAVWGGQEFDTFSMRFDFTYELFSFKPKRDTKVTAVFINIHLLELDTLLFGA